jgi:sulfate/thiosulfate transport system permease protein
VPAEAQGKLRVAVEVRLAREDPPWVRRTLVATAIVLVGFLIIIPLVNVFAEALVDGPGVYWKNLVKDKDTLHSIELTFTVVPFALVLNVVFGFTAAWCISRFSFPGRSVLTALIDLPFSVSPVVVGLMFVLIFGLQGYCGKFLREDGYSIMPYVVGFLIAFLTTIAYLLFRPRDRKRQRGFWRLPPWMVILVGGAILFGAAVAAQKALGVWPEHKSLKIIFATPGLILVTAFVTAPFVARELIPIMDAVGPEEEMAAVSLGANGWQMFWHITLPNVKWGLVYGVILCTSRAIGEFGAVYVVSGHIAGQTDTMPLRIEKLFQEYNLSGSFAVASLLTVVALVTLIVKSRLEKAIPRVAITAEPPQSERST